MKKIFKFITTWSVPEIVIMEMALLWVVFGINDQWLRGFATCGMITLPIMYILTSIIRQLQSGGK